MNRLLAHLRHHVVGYLALFVALAGTSYAAVRIPVNSVGERQLRNHSIDPVKFNPRYIGGYVRAWAEVDGTGKVIASSGKVRVADLSAIEPGLFRVDWPTRPHAPCTSLVSVDEHEPTASAGDVGFAVSGTTQNRARTSTGISTFGPSGQPEALSFDVLLVC